MKNSYKVWLKLNTYVIKKSYSSVMPKLNPGIWTKLFEIVHTVDYSYLYIIRDSIIRGIKS
jgi:hypothetical protein